VTQTGICGFGHNVSAEGSYKKGSFKSRSSNRLKVASVLFSRAVAVGNESARRIQVRASPQRVRLQNVCVKH
jgi:hypothetical protein